MNYHRFIFILVASAALVGCGLSDQQKADYAAVQRSTVSSAIYDKMVHGDPLSVGDICALSRAGVSDAIVLRYVRDQGTVYTLNSGDFARLHKAGVSPSVVDYMANTGYSGPYGPYGPYGPGPYGPYGYPYPYPPVAIGLGFGFGGGGRWR
jgi:hypothetical protein